MATDCEKLTENAKKIFKKLEPFFPPDPWHRPMWHEGGVVESNGLYDLRKSRDRNGLIEKTISTIGSFVENKANVHQKQNKSLDGFEIAHFGPMIKERVELLFILRELDFQIETLDYVDS